VSASLVSLAFQVQCLSIVMVNTFGILSRFFDPARPAWTCCTALCDVHCSNNAFSSHSAVQHVHHDQTVLKECIFYQFDLLERTLRGGYSELALPEEYRLNEYTRRQLRFAYADGKLIEPADEVLLDVFSQGVLGALVPCSRSKLEMPLLFDLTTWPADSIVAVVSSIDKFRYNFFQAMAWQ